MSIAAIRRWSPLGKILSAWNFDTCGFTGVIIVVLKTNFKPACFLHWSGHQWWRRIATNLLNYGDLPQGRGRPLANAVIAVEEICRYFTDQVGAIGVGTVDAPKPTLSLASAGSSFTEFELVSIGNIIPATGCLRDKSFSTDPLTVYGLQSVAS
jgi:hypothetical protein